MGTVSIVALCPISIRTVMCHAEHQDRLQQGQGEEQH